MRANGPKTWGYTLVLVGFILAVGGHLGSSFSRAQSRAITEARWRDVDRQIDEIWGKHWTRLKANLLSLGELGLRTVEETATGPRFDVPDELETLMTRAVEETADELSSAFADLTFIVKANIIPRGAPATIPTQPLPIFVHGQKSGDLPPEAVGSPSQFGLRLDGGRSQLELHFGPSMELDSQDQYRERAIFGKYFPETPIKYVDIAGNEMAGGLIGRTALYIYSRREYVSPPLYNILAVLLTRLGQFGILLLLIAPPVWVYLDARRKRLPAGLWGLFALITSVIGMLVYTLVTRESGLVCPECGERVSSRFVVCPYCQTELKGTCPTCGQTVGLNWNYCPSCSTEL